ncbi:hypothetical protein cyc_00168 [Cyclospora cayetanensis]|uniref:Uncharacterized protein n=1 Tax=Cyclospora cayetanensis TaxID=88456 RepID=A0A1D3CXL4_9EIME|nr:hypothetical protein cyc_00168 [Cyclospora cayetanensis]
MRHEECLTGDACCREALEPLPPPQQQETAAAQHCASGERTAGFAWQSPTSTVQKDVAVAVIATHWGMFRQPSHGDSRCLEKRRRTLAAADSVRVYRHLPALLTIAAQLTSHLDGSNISSSTLSRNIEGGSTPF